MMVGDDASDLERTLLNHFLFQRFDFLVPRYPVQLGT
jgi:hypothetical protein